MKPTNHLQEKSWREMSADEMAEQNLFDLIQISNAGPDQEKQSRATLKELHEFFDDDWNAVRKFAFENQAYYDGNLVVIYDLIDELIDKEEEAAFERATDPYPADFAGFADNH